MVTKDVDSYYAKNPVSAPRCKEINAPGIGYNCLKMKWLWLNNIWPYHSFFPEPEFHSGIKSMIIILK